MHPAISQQIVFLQQNSEPVNCESISGLKVRHVYYQQQVPGSLSKMFLRKSLASQLEKVISDLAKSGYELLVLDAFRTNKAQEELFAHYLEKAKQDIGCEVGAYHLTARYWTDPKKTRSANKVSPHNSGAAIDVTLLKDGVEVDMGSDFDEMSERSASAYYESNWQPRSKISEQQWLSYRRERDLLRSAMESHGFLNYPEEWWHFDLGDIFWAEAVGSAWQYPSMEEDVLRML